MPLADTATWIAVGFAVAAAALALVASLVLLALVHRRGRGAEGAARATAGGTLVAALEDARAESRRSRRLAEIAATLDLDAVLDRTLAAAVEAAGADAALLVVGREDAEPLLASVGMTAAEAALQPVSRSPSGGGARAVRISYRYDHEDEAAGAAIRGGVAVPVPGEDGSAGTLAVFWRGPDRGLGDLEVGRLEELAASAGPAVANARRFREVRLLADADPVTGLPSRRAFESTLARECARAQRYERRLAVVLLDVHDDPERSRSVREAVLAAVADRLEAAVRRADMAFRLGGGEFAVLLPESTERDAEQLYRRVQFAVAPGAGEGERRIRVSAGIAELSPVDDPVAFLERADEALVRARSAGRGQVRRAGPAGA